MVLGKLLYKIHSRAHLLHPLYTAGVERLILERGEDDDAGEALVCASSAKGRRHRNSPLAVDLVHESGEKQFHFFPQRSPVDARQGAPDRHCQVSPHRQCPSMGEYGISWYDMGVNGFYK